MERHHHTTGFSSAMLDGVQAIIDGIVDLQMTTHSIVNALNDKNTIVPMPTFSILKDGKTQLIELYVSEEGVEKFVVRDSKFDDFDYTYVISKHGIIITNWSNEKDDIPTLKKKSSYYSSYHGETREYPECLEL